MHKRTRSRTRLSLIAVLALAGCASTPDFVAPAAPDVAAYTTSSDTASARTTASAPTAFGEAQRIVPGASVPAQWWKALGSPRLDALIEQAFAASPTLASARATLRQAQETLAAREGATLYPQAEAGVGAQRQQVSPSAQGLSGDTRAYSLYNASVGVRYQLDLSGSNRRALEALAARSDHRRYQLEGARLTLAGNIVTAAITRARFAAQIDATEVMLVIQSEQLRLTGERVRLGHAAADETLALLAQLEQTRATLPPLRKQLQQSGNLLAVLAGRAPGAAANAGAGDALAFTLAEFALPRELPLSLPSELVRRRPDIQAAEALLHAANAEYGVAIAKLYPQLTLSANLGTQALATGALFGGGSAVWGLVAQLTQPLFSPGLPAEKRASLAAFDAAAANYQIVVLESLRNVADVLHALDNDAQTLAALAAADAASQASLESTQRRFALGAASELQVLVAQQQAQQNRIGLIAAQAQRLADSASLYQAMGGGETEESPRASAIDAG